MIKKKKAKKKIEVQKGEISFDDNKRNYKFQSPQVSMMEDTENAVKRRSGKNLTKHSRGGY